MSLELIIGSANAGKTEAAYRRLVDRTTQGRPALLLLPSAPDVSRATADLLGRAAAVGLQVRTFDDQLDRLWRARGDGRQVVSAVQRIAVLAETVNGRTSTEARSFPGIEKTLTLVVQRAAESSRDLPLEPPGDGVGAKLVGLTARYMKILRTASLIERQEAHRRALATPEPLDLPELVVVHGFTGLTASQESFILQASRFTEVLVTLTYSVAAPATNAAADLVHRLEQAGATISALVAPEQEARSELGYLARHLGTVGDGGMQATGAVVLSDAWGEAAEAARITREVQDALGSGMSPGEVGVVFRDVAPHVRELRFAFDEAGIAAEYDVRLPFHRTGMGRVLLTMLAFTGDGPSSSAVMDLLRSPFCPAAHADLDELDAEARRLRSGGMRFAEAWCRTREPQTARFLRDTREACRDVAGGDAERMWYRLIAGMLGSAYQGTMSADFDVLADFAAARLFLEAQQGLSGLGIPVAASTLAEALRNTEIALQGQGRGDRVHVTGAERVRGTSYRCLIVGGLQAGEFPRRVGEGALSAPGISAYMARYGIDVGTRVGIEEERLLFYQTVTRATERLVLSWQSHDADGRPLRHSSFLDEVLDLYRGPAGKDPTLGVPPCTTLGLDAQSVSATAPRSSRRERRERLLGASAAGGSDVPAEWSETGPRRSITALPDLVAKHLGDREAFSASEIETYLHCPYQWFVGRLVRPRELDQELDAATDGRAAHEIMRRFYDAFCESTGESRVLPDTLGRAREIHSRIAADVQAGLHAVTAAEVLMVRALAGKTMRMIENDATLLPGMAPVLREWAFGMGEGGDPEPFPTFSLKGRIDRIDADPRRLVITDYKSGTIDQNHAVAAFAGRGLVQLPLYAEVARRRLGRKIAGAVYRSFKDSRPRGFVDAGLAGPDFVRTDVRSDEEIELEIKGAIDRASMAVEGIRSGWIAPHPITGICPPFCVARTFCAEWRPGRG